MKGRHRLGSGPIDRLVVVVPARDEERLLGPCLDSVAVAGDLATARTGVLIDVIVVLDRCIDDTKSALAGRPSVRGVTSRVGMVGAARALGVQVALHDGGSDIDRSLRQTWLACTDADSQVPQRWLSHQLELAALGADLVLGTVDLVTRRPDDLATRTWRRRYAAQLTDSWSHPHIHGANLGIRASTYLDAGGFAEVEAHEDVLLTEAVAALTGSAIVRTTRHPVLTSARRRGRAPAGVAVDLRMG